MRFFYTLWHIIGVFIFALCMGSLVNTALPSAEKPVYKATATIEIDTVNADIFKRQEKVIRSRRIAGFVFKKLKLDTLRRFRESPDGINRLLDNVEVEPVKGEGVFNISAYEENPKLASLIVNGFSIEYIRVHSRIPHVKNAVVQDIAKVPISPLRPNRKVDVLLCAIVGIAGGSSIAYVKSKRRAHSSKEKENNLFPLEFPVIGSLPHIKENDFGVKRKDNIYIVTSDPPTPASEALRSIRSKVLHSFRDRHNPTETIVVTSAFSGEGKTTIAVNLAIMMAEGGEKTLLVDTNITKPRLHKMFNGSDETGLLNFLYEESDFGSIIKKTEVNNLYIVPLGKGPYQKIKSVFPERIESFLKKGNLQFSKVIFDAASLEDFFGITQLARHCTGTIIVAERNNRANEVLARSNVAFENAKVNVLGLVIR
ncbi:MAG: P-loop NTPase [Candidatus Omnitrophota bacterium]|nr:P-loop NTPase [Candidatus Omnitrophota bacterium]